MLDNENERERPLGPDERPVEREGVWVEGERPIDPPPATPQRPIPPPVPEPAPRDKRPSKAGYFLSSLAGLLVGALLVWMIAPGLSPLNSPNGMTESAVETPGTTVTDRESPPAANAAVNQASTNIQTGVTQAVDKMSDAVVSISNFQDVGNSDPFLQDMPSSPMPEPQEVGSGSGVVYKKAGDKAFIVTNNHVVAGAKQLEVTLSDGAKVRAKLVGTDALSDLAVIQVPAAQVKKVATFGNSDLLKRGETVIAIGSPIGVEFSGTVTTGVVSGLNRPIPIDLNGDNVVDWEADVIQTDAAINPGNSGGALVNLAGELVGINSMKISAAKIEGIGLAIPINTAIPFIESLEKYGTVKRPAIGIVPVDLSYVPAYHQQHTLHLPASVKEGVVVRDVARNSPAASAGLKQFDTIVALDGNKVANTVELRKTLYAKAIGGSVKVTFYRGSETKNVVVKLDDEQRL